MTIELLPSLPAGSPEWHDQRRHLIGGSEIAAVMGLSPWESPFSLWHRKAGNIAPLDLDGEAPVHWGKLLEPTVRQEWMRLHRDTHYVRPELGVTVANGVAIASPDAVVSLRGRGYSLDREVLEVKTALYPDQWGPSGTDEVPVHYRCQVVWYMGALGLRRAHFAVLIGAADYREYTVEFDSYDYRVMYEAAESFIETLTAGIPPALDASDATYQAVRTLHPEIDRGESAEIDTQIAHRYLATKAEKENVDLAYREVCSQILDAAGNAQHVRTPDGTRVAYRMARGDSKPFLVADKAAYTKHNAPTACA